MPDGAWSADTKGNWKNNEGLTWMIRIFLPGRIADCRRVHTEAVEAARKASSLSKADNG